MQLRFIHSADWQLGMTRHFLSPEAQARFTQARLDAVRALGEAANAHAADFIVVAGDVFESHQLTPATRSRALAALAELPVPVVLLPGNHDPFAVGSIWQSADFRALEGSHVRLLTDASPVQLGASVEVLGAPWLTKRPETNPLTAAIAPLAAAKGKLRIAVGHGAVDTLTPDLTQVGVLALDELESWLAEGLVHYIALGDRHSFTPVGTSGRICYAGAPEPTDFDESDPGKVLLVEFTAADRAPAITPIETGTWTFVRRDNWQLDSAADVDALADWLAALPAKERCIVKFTANGSLPLSELARLETLLSEQRELFAALIFDARHNDVHLAVDPAETASLPLIGFAREACDVLLEKAKDNAAARDALVLLQRLATKDRG